MLVESPLCCSTQHSTALWYCAAWYRSINSLAGHWYESLHRAIMWACPRKRQQLIIAEYPKKLFKHLITTNSKTGPRQYCAAVTQRGVRSTQNKGSPTININDRIEDIVSWARGAQHIICITFYCRASEQTGAAKP